MVCLDCGAENATAARFCLRCGWPLAGGAWGAAPPAASPSPPHPAPAPPSAAYGYRAPEPPVQPPPAYGYRAPVRDTPPVPDPAPAPDGAAAPEPPMPAPRKRHRRRNILLALGLLILLGAGAGGFLLYQALDRPNLSPARLIPAEVYGYVSVAAGGNGDQRTALAQLAAAFQSQPGFQAAWDRLLKQAPGGGAAWPAALAACGAGADARATGTPGPLDDLAAYLGNDITLALLPLSPGELAGLSGGAALDTVLRPKLLLFVDLDFNPLNTKGLLRAITQQASGGTNLALLETYRDVQIRKLPLPPCAAPTGLPDAYVALLVGTAAVAFDPAPLHAVIDRYHDGHSLWDSPAYAAVVADLPAARLATVYLNVGALSATAQTIAAAAAVSDTNPLATLPPATGRVALAVSAHDDGLQVDIAGDTLLGGPTVSAAPAPSAAILNDVPMGSWGFYSGSGLQTTIQQALDAIRQGPNAADLDRTLAQARADTGIDFEREVLPLLNGDYLVSVAGRAGEGGLIGDAAGEIRLRPGDGARLGQVVDALNQYAASQGSTVSTLRVAGTTLTRLAPDSGLLYSVAGDKLFVLATTDPAPGAPERWAGTVLAGQGQGADAAVRARLAHLPAQPNAALYIDLTKIRSAGLEALLSADSRAAYGSQVAPLLCPLQYLVLGGRTSPRAGQTHTRAVLFVGIGPVLK